MAKKSRKTSAEAEISQIYVPEPMTDLEEPHKVRSEAYKELRRHPLFDPDLIREIEGYRYSTPVSWVKAEGIDPEIADDMLCPVVEEEDNRSIEEILKWGREEFERLEAESQPTPSKTTGELMAAILRHHVYLLLEAECSGSFSPVRTDNMLSRRTIAEIALDMLEGCVTFRHLPGPELASLFRALLAAEGPRLTSSRRHEARYTAAWVVAQVEISCRELARFVGVNASTVTRWLKDVEFQAEVESNRQFIEQQKSMGRWPPSLPGSPAQA
jgi:hypothetical protein